MLLNNILCSAAGNVPKWLLRWYVKSAFNCIFVDMTNNATTVSNPVIFSISIAVLQFTVECQCREWMKMLCVSFCQTAKLKRLTKAECVRLLLDFIPQRWLFLLHEQIFRGIDSFGWYKNLRTIIHKSRPNSLNTLMFRSHHETFIRRSWYSVIPHLDVTISCHVKKTVVGMSHESMTVFLT